MRKNFPKIFFLANFFAILFLSFSLVALEKTSYRPQVLSLQSTYEVVVVGAGTGGISAAIQAARLGAKVLVVEETDWIGGQMTAAAVSTLDQGSPLLRTNGGIFQEFTNKILAYYSNPQRFPPSGKSIGTCYSSSGTYCFEPHVGKQILYDMVNETGNITISLRTKVTTVQKEGNKVTGVVTNKGTFTAPAGKIFILIDATEYGDIIPLTGAASRVGNNQTGACIQDITYAAVIKNYGSSSAVPPALKITAPPTGYDNGKKVEFARSVTNAPAACRPTYPWSFSEHNAYRGLPDSSNPNSYTGLQPEQITKTVLNFANDYPAYAPYNPPSDDYNKVNGLILKADYINNPSYRKTANCLAKLKTYQFIYYLQSELGKTSWSIANDEGYCQSPDCYNLQENDCPEIPNEFEKHFPVIPYVRESRRLVGVENLTGRDTKRLCPPNNKGQKAFSNALAIGYYPTDLHNCKWSESLEAGETVGDMNSSCPRGCSATSPGTSCSQPCPAGAATCPKPCQTCQQVGDTPCNTSFIAGAFQVPYGSFIPQVVDGFLAAEKNYSQSRIANGATRLQPETMLTGQAVGAIAALSVKNNTQPRKLNPAVVQWQLLNNPVSAPLSLYPLNQTAFTDVPLGNPYWKEVQHVVANKISVGYANGSFGINDVLTRAQISTMFVNLFKIPLINPATPSFTDVPTSFWAFRHIETLKSAGLVSGCTATTFCPNSSVSKVQAALQIAKGLYMRGLAPNPTSIPKDSAHQVFTDIPTTHYGFGSVYILKDKGVMQGCTAATFCPTQTVTRGEFAKYASQVLMLPKVYP